MALKEFINKLTSNTKRWNLRKFKKVSKQCAGDPINAYSILKNEFSKEIREIAIKNSREKHKEDWKKLSIDQKEAEIEMEQKKLWGKIKSGGTNALAVIFGISIG